MLELAWNVVKVYNEISCTENGKCKYYSSFAGSLKSNPLLYNKFGEIIWNILCIFYHVTTFKTYLRLSFTQK